MPRTLDRVFLEIFFVFFNESFALYAIYFRLKLFLFVLLQMNGYGKMKYKNGALYNGEFNKGFYKQPW